MRIAGLELQDPRPIAGGDICRAVAARLPDGSAVFAKTLVDPPPDFFAAEARGLDLVRVDAGPPVPRVRAVGPDGLVLDLVPTSAPSEAAAASFGHRLAGLHRAGGDCFGADSPGYVGTVRVDNTPSTDWPTFYGERRLAPVLRDAEQRGAVSESDAAAIRTVIDRLPDLAGPPEPPARIHGDLWAGNLLWADDGEVWLIDAAAAHDGHRETDLAMLALFGAPYLETIVSAYDAAYALAAGWQARVGLHQLYPLLIHATLFGGGYGARAASLARSVLGRRG